MDITKIRHDTPACQQLIHFNNAGSSLLPLCVTTAVTQHQQLEQEIGGYEAATEAQHSIQRFYSSLASLLNCKSSEIACMESATRGWNIAVHSLELKPGDKIITFQNEYTSNYLGLLHLAKLKGIVIEVVPLDQAGLVDLEKLESAIDNRTRLISMTHVASPCGDIQPAAKVGKLARAAQIPFLLDACQSLGQMSLDVKEIGCDLLCASGRKFMRAPRGTGFLFVSENIMTKLQPVFVDQHAAELADNNHYQLANSALRFESWERSIANVIGHAHAVEYALDLGLDAIRQRIKLLTNELRQQMTTLPDIEILERSDQLSGIVTFSKKNENPDTLTNRLRQSKLNISISKQLISRLGAEKLQYRDINRASIHYYNSSQEIQRFAELLSQAEGDTYNLTT